MMSLKKTAPILLLAAFVFVAAVGSWQVLQRFEGVHAGLPVEALKWHRGVSSLIQVLGNLTEKLGVAQSSPTTANLNQLTIALDTVIAVEQSLDDRVETQDRMGTGAVRRELIVLLAGIETVLDNPGTFEAAQARRLHARLIYLSNELEAAYLATNERIVAQLSRQADLLGGLKNNVMVLLGLIAFAIGIIFVFLIRAHRSNVLLMDSQADLEGQRQSLKDVNKRLESAQRLAHLGNWSWDVASGVVSWSDEAFRIFGHQPHAIAATYDAFMQAVHPEDRDKVQAAVSEAMENHTPYAVDHRVVLTDGQVRYVQEQGEATYADDGTPLRMDGTVLDITSHVHSELAIRENEQRFRSMVDNAGDAIYIHDRYGKIYDVNHVACDQTGYTKEELLELSVAQLDVAIDYDNLRETWDLGEADPKQYPLTLETAHRRKDGTVFPIEVRISLLPADDGHLFVAMVRDISERKQVEQELAFQKSALDQHAIVSIADVKGDITYVNDKFCTISGYTREELVGKNHRIVKSSEHSQDFYKNLWRTIASGKTWRGEIRNLKKGGHDDYWVDASIVPFLGEDGKPFQYVAIRTDITDRVRARQEAETANKAKSEFLSSMSHELRTPLNAICGFSQLLETDRKNPLTEKQLVMVNQISRGGQHLLGLINDILDLAKIEAGKLTISLEQVAPWEIVHSALALVANMGEKRNVHVALEESIHCPTCTEPCTIFVDQNRFRQVLLNLLSNAVKYNRDGGRVTLRCARTNGLMRFTVTDTGMGIPETLQNELFTPFHRLGAESGEIEGTGIGLTITKTLAELMHGEIGFSSREGEGSEFWVAFPLTDQVTPAVFNHTRDDEQKIAALSGAHKHVVLYIEDNPANLHLMEMIFERLESVLMISAHTAELGLEMAERERPDLILMDINLPGMNGVEALKQVQSSESLRRTPVVAVSANAMKHDIERALQLGFKGYITKPFEVSEIIDVVSSLIK